jgi:hypothetical protein
MSKKRKPPLFYRSFHLTLGGAALILPIFIWITDHKNSGNWPLRAWILLFVLFIGGLCIFLFGILASDEKIHSRRIAATSDNFLVAILAFPLYLVLKAIRRKKHDQSLHGKHNHTA